MKVMGIIFANDATVDALTSSRTMASLPFGGRYRQVDFHLSNMAAAGIRHVGIVSRHNYQSLMNHVGSGEEWGLEMEEGGLEFLTPYAMSVTNTYRGKLDALHSVLGFLEYGSDDEYVIMADSAVLSNMDLNAVLESHIASGKDITVVTKTGIADGKKQLDLALKLDESGEIIDMAVDYVADKSYLASMDVFVLSKTWLKEKVKEFIARNLFHMDRDLVLGQWQKGEITVNVYEFSGVALFNDTPAEYFRNSLALIDSGVRHDLFGGNHPVFTRVRDRVPSYYGENCEVEDSIVADGCIIEGEVEESVLFRDVTVCEGAEVENCVIMNNTVIGEGAELKYVILDKDVTVRPGARLIGTENNPIIITRGETV
ncbi:glucose-1-phosphate adenylyltransferase subunit GlgD [Succinimonas sp.]|uniref:glucose-1-phosphate adenylyltransferase subunit GlgD n=1 Tax=Succinimonas sp. TaxID=1936151 RepID=UPI003864032B